LNELRLKGFKRMYIFVEFWMPFLRVSIILESVSSMFSRIMGLTLEN
jgi:hypothetical protein